MKFVFFGTRELGAKVLERLLSDGYSPSLVVTSSDKPVGRKQLLTPSPVKLIAEKFKLPIFQPPDLTNSAIAELTRQKIDMFILAAYGNILPKELVELPPKGALNVHPSLLPLYRGPSPERGTLLNGEEKTGVTVIVMDEKVDHGPILAQREFIIPKDMRHEELHAALGELGGELLVETIPGWLGGTTVPKEQDHSKATYTKKLTKEDGRIDWSKPAEYIERQVRALYPWPGTFTKLKVKSDPFDKTQGHPERSRTDDPFDKTQGHPERSRTDEKLKMIKILKAHVIDGDPSKNSGETFLASGGKLAVQTGKDALIIEELQLEGGKPMSSKEFLLGYKGFLGTTLS